MLDIRISCIVLRIHLFWIHEAHRFGSSFSGWLRHGGRRRSRPIRSKQERLDPSGSRPWFSFKEDLSECDGLIARIESKEEAKEVRGYRIPVVDIASAVRLPTLAQVHNDDHLTGKRAGSYLKGLGIEHFGYCSAEGLIWAKERLRGIRRRFNGKSSTSPARWGGGGLSTAMMKSSAGG